MSIITHTVPDRIIGPEPPTQAQLEEAAAQTAIATLEARIARVEAHLWPPVAPDAPTTDAPTWQDLGGVWPVGGLCVDGGKTWRNVSGVPLTTPPSGFPGGAGRWGHLFVVHTGPKPVDPPTAPPWKVGEKVKVSDLRAYGGKTYKCVTAHTTQADWAPGKTPSLWVVA